MVGVFGFAGGPTYRATTRGEMFNQAMDRPMSQVGTFFDQAVGGAARSLFAGSVRQDLTIPEGVPDPRTVATRSFSMVTSPLLGAYELLRSATQSRMDQGKPLTQEEYKASKYFRERIPWDSSMTDSRAAALAMEDDTRSVREHYASKRPWTAFAGNFLGQMVDPINYVPFVSQGMRAAQIAKFGGFGGRIMAGSVDAAANTAAFTTATAPIRARYGDDVSWQAMTSEIALSAALGGAFGAIGGGFSKAWNVYTGRQDAQLAETRKALLSDIDKKLSTMPNIQKSVHGLNEAVVSGVRGEDINLSPNALDAARIMSDRLTNDPTLMRSPMGEEMRSRFEAAGRPAGEAHSLGRVYEDAYESFARRSGMTLDAFVAKVGLPEVRGGEAAARAPDAAAVAQAAVSDPAFRAWFGNSKVVDESGTPRVVHHGTPGDTTIDSFRTPSFFAGERGGAEWYTTKSGEGRGRVEDVYLAIEKPLDVRDEAGAMKFIDIARRAGVDIKVTRGKYGWTFDDSGEISANSPYDGTNLNDLIYSPRVREQMAVEGYDGLLAWDALENGEIEAWVPLSPTQIKSVNNRGTFDPNDPNILNQSATIRRGEETLKKYGLDPKKKYTTREVATALEARQRKKYGTIARGDYSSKAMARIARWATEEVMFEVNEAVKNPSKSAVGWYSTKYQRAIDNMGARFPEFRDSADFADPNLPGLARLGNATNARNFYTVLMAVLSDGAKVRDNFRRATDLYEDFRLTGRLKLDFAFGGDRNLSMKTNLAQIERMLGTYGPEEMHRVLLRTATVKELKQIAKEEGQNFKTPYKVDTVMPYSAAVFGPKLGAFYANLMGDTGYLTMDRWWSRTFNRYRGTLLTEPTKVGLEKFKRAVSLDRQLNEPPEMMTDDEAIALAAEYAASYAKKGFKQGSDIEKMANTVYKAARVTLEDQPFSASDREFMIATAVRVQGNLRRQGVDLTIADIQAVLWYYEKRLYVELGARETADLSYEEIANEVARERGGTARSADEVDGDAKGESGLDAPTDARAGHAEGDSVLDDEFTLEQSAAPRAANQAEQADTGGRAGAEPARRADPEGLKLPAGTSRWHEGPGGHIPVNMDGMFRITHETDRVLDKIDPLKRKFIRGNREAERLGPVGTEGTAERAYYGVGDLNYKRPKGQPYKVNTDPYHGEGRGHLRHVVAVDPDTIYNYKQDRLGLYGRTDAATPSERQTQYEKFIEEAGFKGAYLSETDVGQTAMMFEPMEPEIVINKNTGLPVDEIDPKSVKLMPKELEPLPGLTTGRPIKRVVQAARAYAENHDIPVRRQARYVTADPDRGARIAAAYEAMQHAPNDPAVREAYAAMAEETLAQYQYVKATGLKVDAIEPGQKDPYPQGPKQVLADLEKGHLWFFPTDQGFGTLTEIGDNPLLAMTDEFIGNRQLVVNDVFRIVHDFFGHGIEGSGFGARGEENAWQSHMRLYSERALPAVTSETRGQNSWVNFGPFGEQNRANQRETVFADQKTGIMPEWTWREGVEDDVPATLFQQPARSLMPAIKVGKEVYSAEGLHLDALATVPENARRAVALDADTRGFVTEKGRFLDRYKAQKYALDHGLIKATAPRWAYTSPELIAENLGDGTTLFQPKSQGVRGSITFSHTPVIKLFESADASTALHESGHLFLEIFKGLADSADAPAALKADWDAVKTWWGDNSEAVAADANKGLDFALSGLTPAGKTKGKAKAGSKSKELLVTANDVLSVLAKGTTGDAIKDRAVNIGLHEQWARGFESYLRDGTAPTPELRSVFQQFKEWLTKIYTHAKQLNVRMTPEIRGVFDRMLGADVQRQIDTTPARPDPLPSGLTEALARIGTTEDTAALAEQFQVDPQTGAFPEEDELAALVESGRLSEDDLAELTQASEDFEVGAAYGEAMKSLVGCMI